MASKNTLTLSLVLTTLLAIPVLAFLLITDKNTVPSVQPNVRPIDPSITPACGDSAKVISLGRPRVGGEVAYFNTADGDVYVTATGFEHGGYFDPDVGKTMVYVGKGDKLPTYNEQSSAVSNAAAELLITENKYTPHRFEEGRYWAWTSNGVEVRIASCNDISL